MNDEQVVEEGTSPIMVKICNVMEHHQTKMLLILLFVSAIWSFGEVLLFLHVFQLALDYLHWTWHRSQRWINACLLVVTCAILVHDMIMSKWFPFSEVFGIHPSIWTSRHTGVMMTKEISVIPTGSWRFALGIVILMKKGLVRILGVPFYVFVLGLAESFGRFSKTSLQDTRSAVTYARLIIEIVVVVVGCSLYGLISLINAPGKAGAELRDSTQNADLASVKSLLERGFDPNTTDKYKCTPLHICAQQALVSIGKLLLDHGSDPNLQDLVGFTALHWAVQVRREEPSQENRLKLIRLLMSHGADPHIEDQNGNTPLKIASRNGNEVALRTLKEFIERDMNE